MSIGLGAGAAVGGGISAIGGLAGSAISSGASSSAAKTQAAAAQAAVAEVAAQQQVTNSNLQGFVGLGQQAENTLANMTGVSSAGAAAYGGPSGSPLLAPYQAWNPTEAGLEATPGYQFTLGQGLESTQNSFAAQGLASSGAALKGAASYATGLADSTYNQQYQNYLAGKSSYLQQNQQTINDLSGIAGLGENASVQAGSLGQASTAQQANLQTSGAAASAAGTVGSANAVSSGLTGASNSLAGGLTNYALLNQLQGSGLLGGAAQNSGPGNIIEQ